MRFRRVRPTCCPETRNSDEDGTGRKSLPMPREVRGNRFDPAETTQSGQRSPRRQPRCRTKPSPYAARPRAAACTRSPRRGPSPKGVVELEPRPCENSRTFSHGPISFAFLSPETVQRRRNHGNLRSAPPVAKFRGVLTRPQPKGDVEHETHRSPESQPKEQRLAYGGQRQVPAQWNRLGARTHPTLPPDHRAGGSAMSEPPGRKSESGSGSQASKRRGTT
jgi:hypothetical protein